MNCSQSTPRHRQDAESFLPLSGGEGRGEGELLSTNIALRPQNELLVSKGRSMNDGDAPARTPAWLKWARGLNAHCCLRRGWYLAWVAIHHGPAAGCGPTSGCSAVLQSRWAYWLNIPVSAPAVLVYLALFGATIPSFKKYTAPDDQRVPGPPSSSSPSSWPAPLSGSSACRSSSFNPFANTASPPMPAALPPALICLFHIPYATTRIRPCGRPVSGKRGVPRARSSLSS